MSANWLNDWQYLNWKDQKILFIDKQGLIHIAPLDDGWFKPCSLPVTSANNASVITELP